MADDSHEGGSILPGITWAQNYIHDAQKNRSVHITARQLIITFLIVNGVFFVLAPNQTINNYNLVILLSPIWLTYILFQSTVARYVQMKRAEYLARQEYVLLEIRMPRDTSKTPQAMEAFFSSLHIGSGESTWYKLYVQGAMRPWWSFEIASLGGRIHFYVWTRKDYRRLVESYMYAQYPDIEIIEAEDYSRLTDLSQEGYGMWGCEYEFSDHTSEALPLKTYVDYEMKPGDKPEETVDPLAQMLELMGSIGPTEQFWLQIIIRQTKGEKYAGRKTKEGKPYSFKAEALAQVEMIRQATTRKSSYVDPGTGKTVEVAGFPNPTKGQNETIASIERKAGKQVFDVGIRCIYGATEDSFNRSMIPAQLTLFKPFNNETGNRLGVQSVFGGSFNDFPWEDPGGHHREHLKHEIVNMYRRRIYYADPYIGEWLVLSTEELASLYHVPSSAVTTPNLPRIQSTTTGAPANLPT